MAYPSCWFNSAPGLGMEWRMGACPFCWFKNAHRGDEVWVHVPLFGVNVHQIWEVRWRVGACVSCWFERSLERGSKVGDGACDHCCYQSARDRGGEVKCSEAFMIAWRCSPHPSLYVARCIRLYGSHRWMVSMRALPILCRNQVSLKAWWCKLGLMHGNPQRRHLISQAWECPVSPILTSHGNGAL